MENQPKQQSILQLKFIQKNKETQSFLPEKQQQQLLAQTQQSQKCQNIFIKWLFYSVVIFYVLVLFLNKTQNNLLEDRKLKVLLYPAIPFTSQINKPMQLQKLKEMIQQKVDQNNINVVIEIQNNSGSFYNSQAIIDLYEEYDIIQIDLEMLQSIQKGSDFQLLKWTQQQMKSSKQSAYDCNWIANNRIISNKSYYVGFPSMMCANFIYSANNKAKAQQKEQLVFLQKKYLPYQLVNLYLGFYLNIHQNKKFTQIDYSSIDQQVFHVFKLFFLICQSQQQQTLDIYDNYCLNDNLNQKTNASSYYQQNNSYYQQSNKKTYHEGFSQTILNLWKLFNISQFSFKFQNSIMGNLPIRTIYLDHFIAKDPKNQQDRETILKFVKFMISNQILDIYIKGQYFNIKRQQQGLWPKYTYLLPPKKQYFQKLSLEGDENYKLLYNLFLNNGNSFKYVVIQGIQYYQNTKTFAQKLKQKLDNQLNLLQSANQSN